MHYDISSQPFELRLSAQDIDDLPLGLKPVDDSGTYRMEFHEEDFSLDEYFPFLRKASRKHSIRVNFMDHKGCSSYDLHFGPGYCREDEA